MKAATCFWLGLMLCICVRAEAAVILEPFSANTAQWGTSSHANTPADTTGTGDGSYGVLQWAANLGGHAGALQILGGAASGVQEDYISADISASPNGSGNPLLTEFAGNFNSTNSGGSGHLFSNGVGNLTFDFYANANASDDLPSSLDVYFYSSSANGGAGATWFYSVDAWNTLQSGWNTVTVSFTNNLSRWYDGTDWAGAFADVDEIGLMLGYQVGFPDQEFGIDNWTLNEIPSSSGSGPGPGSDIPEPETYAVLAFTFISLAITFRRKLNDTFCLVRTD